MEDNLLKGRNHSFHQQNSPWGIGVSLFGRKKMETNTTFAQVQLFLFVLSSLSLCFPHFHNCIFQKGRVSLCPKKLILFLGFLKPVSLFSIDESKLWPMHVLGSGFKRIWRRKISSSVCKKHLAAQLFRIVPILAIHLHTSFNYAIRKVGRKAHWACRTDDTFFC